VAAERSSRVLKNVGRLQTGGPATARGRPALPTQGISDSRLTISMNRPETGRIGGLGHRESASSCHFFPIFLPVFPAFFSQVDLRGANGHESGDCATRRCALENKRASRRGLEHVRTVRPGRNEAEPFRQTESGIIPGQNAQGRFPRSAPTGSKSPALGAKRDGS
jgi:hypothetical protein